MYLVLGGTWSGGCTWSGGVHLVPGGVPGWGVPGPRGYLVRGCTWSGGCTWSRGGAPGPGEGGVPGQVLSPCGQTDACKNITFATSLRTVITN